MPESLERFELTSWYCVYTMCVFSVSSCTEKLKAAALAGGDRAQHDDQLSADQEQAEKTVRHGRRKASRETIRNGESGVVSSRLLPLRRCRSLACVFSMFSYCTAQQSHQVICVSKSTSDDAAVWRLFLHCSIAALTRAVLRF